MPVNTLGTAAEQIPNPPASTDPRTVNLFLQQLVDTLRRTRSADGQALSATAEAQLLISDAIEALRKEVAAAQEVVETLEQYIATLDIGALTAQQEFELSLTTQRRELFGSSDDVLGAALSESQIAAERALESRVEAFHNEAAIRTEQVVRLTAEENFAQQITTLVTDLGVANAAIVTEQTARTNGDAANAASINAVSTTVAGHTATIATQQTSINGISANWTVALTGNTVSGMVRLDGTNSLSSFDVVADVFRVAQPGVVGGAVRTVFVIGNINGTPALGFNGDAIIDGSILASRLNVATLSAITANIGTATAGLIRDPGDVYQFRVSDGWFGRSDGTSFIDMKNNILQFSA